MKWNDYFQRMLELPEETQEEQVRKCVWISTIAKDFTFTGNVVSSPVAQLADLAVASSRVNAWVERHKAEKAAINARAAATRKA